jgi:methionine-rich copper-binding protein CopC
VIFDTDLDDIFVDLGGSWRQITSEQYYEEDAANWTGSATEVTYDVSSTVDDSRRMIWCLKRNGADYEQIGAEIDFPSATQVRVTVGIPLAAGTYTLVGR